MQAELGVQPPRDPTDRFLNPAIGGGALFDLGVYPISFAQMVLGDPDTVAAHGTLGPHRRRPGGVGAARASRTAAAPLFSSLRCASPGQARVFGTEGWIDVLPRFHHPDRSCCTGPADREEIVHPPATGGGFAHELIEVTECVAAGAPRAR